MRFPVHIMTDMLRWKLRNWARGNRRYPYVLMLEPLHTCNLACLGCSPERYSGDLKDRLSLEQCLAAVDDADLEVWRGQFTFDPPGVAAAGAVPEPTALALGALGALAVVACRRR